MIAFLRGKLLETDGESAVVDVAGVGYQVLVSASTAAALAVAAPRGETQLYVHTHFVKDEPLRLYGFADAGERGLFRDADQRAGGGAARGAGDPGRHRGGRAGARHRHRRRRAG